MRIISLSPSSTELLFAMGAGDDVVGVTQLCDYPAEAMRRERLGSWLHTQPAALDALRPNLIVTTTYRPDELRSYSGKGEVLHLEPSNLSSVFESALLLGRAVGRYQAAERLVQTMQEQLEEIRSHAPAQQLLVYCEAWPDPPMQAGNWVPEIIAIAGGQPVGGLHARPSEPVAVDALQAADPDIMVFHWCDPKVPPDAERIRNRPGWFALRALQANACAFLPNNLLNRPGPRLVEGARHLQAEFQAHQQDR
ncbi:MAG: cobalamin-binding protein [bacterium]|nr:cobalamin-binding protein [bacterium]